MLYGYGWLQVLWYDNDNDTHEYMIHENDGHGGYTAARLINHHSIHQVVACIHHDDELHHVRTIIVPYHQIVPHHDHANMILLTSNQLHIIGDAINEGEEEDSGVIPARFHIARGSNTFAACSYNLTASF